jgi:TATA-box binding protein (TBP) (component of TFIID and TFIIIB)
MKKFNPTVIKSKGMPSAQIVNVVAKYRFVYMDELGDLYPVEINIPKLTKYERIFPFKYNPNNFAAAPIKIFNKEMNTKVTTELLFNTGNTIHTGGETEAEIRDDAYAFNNLLISILGIPLTVIDFKITNIVCKMNMGFNINIIRLHDFLGDDRAKYVPKGPRAFPALRVKRLTGLKEAALIFVSGAVIFGGAKNREIARENLKLIYDMCKSFKDDEITRLTPQEYSNIGRKEALRNFSKKIQDAVIKEEKNDEEIPLLEYKKIIKSLNEKIDDDDNKKKRKRSSNIMLEDDETFLEDEIENILATELYDMVQEFPLKKIRSEEGVVNVFELDDEAISSCQIK